MTLRLHVDVRAPEPAYEQIRSQVAGLVGSGELRAGDRLPTIAALAADLGLAGNTVGRAYQELERAGLVHTRRRLGTVVAEQDAGDDRVVRLAREYAVAARAAGLDDRATIDLLQGALRTTENPPMWRT